MKNTNPRSLPIILLYIFFILLLPIPFTMGILLLSENGILPQLSQTEIGMFINAICYILLPIIALIYYHRKLNLDLKSMNKKIILVIPLILMVFGTSILGGKLVPLIDHTDTTRNQTYLEDLKNMNFYFTAYMAIVAAPITEESVFRMAMIKDARGVKAFPMLLLSSVLFALAHVQGPEPGAFLAYTCIGLPLGCIFLFHRNLLLNILVHSGYNALALMLASLASK